MPWFKSLSSKDSSNSPSKFRKLQQDQLNWIFKFQDVWRQAAIYGWRWPWIFPRPPKGNYCTNHITYSRNSHLHLPATHFKSRALEQPPFSMWEMFLLAKAASPIRAHPYFVGLPYLLCSKIIECSDYEAEFSGECVCVCVNRMRCREKRSFRVSGLTGLLWVSAHLFWKKNSLLT